MGYSAGWKEMQIVAKFLFPIVILIYTSKDFTVRPNTHIGDLPYFRSSIGPSE